VSLKDDVTLAPVCSRCGSRAPSLRLKRRNGSTSSTTLSVYGGFCWAHQSGDDEDSKRARTARQQEDGSTGMVRPAGRARSRINWVLWAAQMSVAADPISSGSPRGWMIEGRGDWGVYGAYRILTPTTRTRVVYDIRQRGLLLFVFGYRLTFGTMGREDRWRLRQ